MALFPDVGAVDDAVELDPPAVLQAAQRAIDVERMRRRHGPAAETTNEGPSDHGGEVAGGDAANLDPFADVEGLRARFFDEDAAGGVLDEEQIPGAGVVIRDGSDDPHRQMRRSLGCRQTPDLLDPGELGRRLRRGVPRRQQEDPRQGEDERSEHGSHGQSHANVDTV
jgi:hypothetical protein